MPNFFPRKWPEICPCIVGGGNQGLFDLEVKTKKLERIHLIKGVYAHSNGKVLTLHLTSLDIYKPQLKIEPRCHVYHGGEESL